MLTTAGIALRAAADNVPWTGAGAATADGDGASWVSTTVPARPPPDRGKRSGRSVATTNSAATHNVEA